ncbi:MAG TPA: AsmA family protein, partial [Burkholderiales bacterium]|nr:AsmA family protein [Burkholderiales bacterium]
MKILKYALYALGALVVLLVAAVLIITATFDPNQYKPQIVQAVKEKTQRTLTLAGDIDLALFPTLGARLGKASLSERGSSREFAAVEDLRIAVKLWPLFSREVVVDAIEVKGLRANLVRYKDGKTNFGDLAGGPAPAGQSSPQSKPTESAPVKIDIAHVEVENAAINYVDQQAGSQYELSRVNLRTGRIASGVPSDIDFAAHVRSAAPKLELDTRLKTRLVFELQQQNIALHNIDLNARGAAAGMTDLTLDATGDLELRPAREEMVASKLAVSVKGKSEGETLNAKFAVPRLAVTQAAVNGERIAFNANLEGGKRKLTAQLEIPAIKGNAKAFTAPQVAGNVDMQDEGATTRLKLATPLSGSIERQHIELSKLVLNVNIKNPKLPRNPLEATVNGALSVDAAKQTANLTFDTRFDESHINGRAGLAKFSPPAYTFDVNVDRLDADRYFPKKPAQPAPGGAAKPQAPGPEPKIDLSALRTLNANGRLQIGALTLSGLKTSNLRVVVKAAGGKVDVNPIAANLYQGVLAGALAVNAAASPTFAIKQKFTGVDIGPLLKDLADKDILEGRGNVTVDATAQGDTVSALKKALNGSAAVRLTDGALKGINIAAAIRGARARLGALRGEQVQAANKTEKTDFSELSASFAIRNGVAHNSDLDMKSPLLRVGGEGDINIAADTIDYLIRASIVGTSKGQGGRELADLQGVTVPVRVTGRLDDPSYKLDFAAIATEAAKKKVESTVREQLEKRLGGGKDKGGGSLKDQLKGLFGR